MEMVGRICKREANHLMRLELSRKSVNYGIKSCVDRLVSYLNLVLGNSIQSEEYWQKGILPKMEEYFEYCFKENEKDTALLNYRNYVMDKDYPISDELLWFKHYVLNEKNTKYFGEHPLIFLFRYFTDKLRIGWNPCCWDSFIKHHTLFNVPEPIDLSDILDMNLGAKHLPIGKKKNHKKKIIINKNKKISSF